MLLSGTVSFELVNKEYSFNFEGDYIYISRITKAGEVINNQFYNCELQTNNANLQCTFKSYEIDEPNKKHVINIYPSLKKNSDRTARDWDVKYAGNPAIVEYNPNAPGSGNDNISLTVVSPTSSKNPVKITFKVKFIDGDSTSGIGSMDKKIKELTVIQNDSQGKRIQNFSIIEKKDEGSITAVKGYPKSFDVNLSEGINQFQAYLIIINNDKNTLTDKTIKSEVWELKYNSSTLAIEAKNSGYKDPGLSTPTVAEQKSTEGDECDKLGLDYLGKGICKTAKMLADLGSTLASFAIQFLIQAIGLG